MAQRLFLGIVAICLLLIVSRRKLMHRHRKHDELREKHTASHIDNSSTLASRLVDPIVINGKQWRRWEFN